MKFTSLLLCVGSAALAQAASASISINVVLTPTLNSGLDAEGFAGSTWSFNWLFNQPTYSDTFGLAAIVSNGATVTVSGAGIAGYNGTFAISDQNTGAFLAVPLSSGNAYVGLNTLLNPGGFDFGASPITVSDLSLVGVGIALPSVLVGDLVLGAHFDGVVLGDNAVTIGGGNYDFGTGVVTATAIPEPGTLALSIGAVALVVAGYRRRRAR